MGFTGVLISTLNSTSLSKKGLNWKNFIHNLWSRVLNVKDLWKTNSKLTIHPFRTMHTRNILPLSPKDYIARFSLELVIITVAIISLVADISLKNHANLLVTNDQSVIFSLLKNYPKLNPYLLSSADTTIITARADQEIISSLNNGILMTSSSFLNSDVDKNSTTIQDNVIVKTNPANVDNFSTHGKSTYDVQPGDSIISIASAFGISPQTIMLENNLDFDSTIKPGQKLSILPTTGMTHKVVNNETVETIAKKYLKSGMDEEQFVEDILDLNNIELPDDIIAGDILILPLNQVDIPNKPKAPTQFVKNTSNKVALKQVPAPANFSGGVLSFIWPTATKQISQGFYSRHTGLDISNSQRVPIYAAEEGYVEISGYQTGYGNTIVINHGNGFKTRYGHATELYVTAGDKVAKGQTIAKQGNTGRVRGATGIHLHFEVIKNGVRVNPLSYVKP